MLKANVFSEEYKRDMVVEYLAPALGITAHSDDDKINDLLHRTELQFALKHQRLEIPGIALMGCLWFSIRAMCHSYFYNTEKHRESGTIIYKRRQFIFNSDSLLYGIDRADYVQILEPGEVLCIRYQDVLHLMSTYTDINDAIRMLAAKQGIYLRERMALNQLSSIERVKRFHAQNDAFLKCSSQEIQAMHVNLGLRRYTGIINKLR